MKKHILLYSFMLVCMAAAAWALSNGGAKEMVLNKDSRKGPVPFPHHLHQKTLNDCSHCHKLFPQQKDAIATLIENGKLMKKDVMKQCLKCHRKMAKAGQKTGPNRCNKCHIK